MSTELLVLGARDSRLLGTAFGCALVAACILIWFLVRRPPLTWPTKFLLFLGLGAMPIASAGSGNVVGYEHTQTREFCGSCHVMEPYTNDAANRTSESLPSIHSRNDHFGENSCYVCHSNYGMYGTVLTKFAGLKHVWHYYTDYADTPIEEALPVLELYEPFPNSNCTRCHSTKLSSWRELGDHFGLLAEIETGETSCVASGCHGPAHAFSKAARAARDGTAPPAPVVDPEPADESATNAEPAPEAKPEAKPEGATP